MATSAPSPALHAIPRSPLEGEALLQDLGFALVGHGSLADAGGMPRVDAQVPVPTGPWHAAALEGRSLSDFLVTRAYNAAIEVIRAQEVMTLSPRAGRAFTAGRQILILYLNV